jgi:hypothetical protein
MAKTAGVRVSATKVSFDDIVVSNYSSAHIMQLIRSAKQRSELKNVPFEGLDTIYSHAVDYLSCKPVCDCCGSQFERKADGKGGGGKRSLSFHRVIASLGYVASNIRIICQGCNNAIGEIQNMDDLSKRFDALAWQTKIMEGRD